MVIFGTTIYIKVKELDSVKLYLFYCFELLITMTLWSVYIDSTKLFLMWGARIILLSLLNYLIAKKKSNDVSQVYCSAPISFVLAVVFTFVELIILVDEKPLRKGDNDDVNESLMKWNNIVFFLGQVATVTYSAFIFYTKKGE